jgi:nitrite reductase/ring-hydroxylating ferredoxin subunit
LQDAGVKVVSAKGQAIAVLYSEGHPYAVDNRCPQAGAMACRS